MANTGLQLIGKVCSNKMDKSVVVIVEIRNWVNKYRTWHKKLRKYMAHDMENTCNIGDVVRIEQIPQKLSKRKAFNVIEVLQRENIVVEDSSGAETAQKSLAGAFTKRPAWAGLSPAAAEGISHATTAYATYYKLSDTAHSLARKLPGWDSTVEVYRQIHGTESEFDQSEDIREDAEGVEDGNRDQQDNPAVS